MVQADSQQISFIYKKIIHTLVYVRTRGATCCHELFWSILLLSKSTLLEDVPPELSGKSCREKAWESARLAEVI
jgi:hypothetical protein